MKPRIRINSKQKAAAAAAVCLFAQQIFGGLNKYIFKLKSAASPGDPAALALLRLGPVHFFWTKIKKEKNDGGNIFFFYFYERGEEEKQTRVVFGGLKSRSDGSANGHQAIVAQ